MSELVFFGGVLDGKSRYVSETARGFIIDRRYTHKVERTVYKKIRDPYTFIEYMDIVAVGKVEELTPEVIKELTR